MNNIELTILIIILIYYFIISAIGVILTKSDKSKSIRGDWRIPEATLMLVGLLGAALPMYLTMKKIRHKTKHAKFMIGLPAEIILHILLLVAVFMIF